MAKQKRKGKNTTAKAPKALSSEAQFFVLGLFIFVLALIGIGRLGPIGNFIVYISAYLTGVLHLFILIALALFGLILFLKRKLPVLSIGLYSFAFIIFFLFVMIAASQKGGANAAAALNNFHRLFENATATRSRFTLRDSTAIATLGGGMIGFLLYGFLSSLLSETGAFIFALVFIIGSAIIIARPILVNTYKGCRRISRMLPEIHLKFGGIKKKEEAQVKVEQVGGAASEPTNTKVTFNVFEENIAPGVNTVPIDDNLAVTPVSNNFRVKEEVKPTESLYLRPQEQEEKVTRTREKAPSSKEYALPPLVLLNTINKSENMIEMKNEALEKAQILNAKFAEFRVRAEVESYTIGPSVTRFEVRPEPGVRVNSIAAIQDDIMLAMMARSIRIEAPIPGKPVVGIEIPNKNREIVSFKDVLVSINPEEGLQIAIGKDIDGHPVTVKLAKMLHLLVAGATGSGKSVCINAIICSLLMRCTPEEVKLMLIDPKRVEMATYASIPHLLCPVISEPKEASIALKRICEEMDERYNTLAKHGQKNLVSFNQIAEKVGEKKLPYIVVIIDELADLMNVASKEVENYIQRITQLARAAGIHLIVATQRPSVNIITGVIKANLPSRIAFAVANGYDSKTILDTIGADQLLGMGDMLMMINGEINIRRVQGCYVTDQEVVAIVDFLRRQGGPEYDDRFLSLVEPAAIEVGVVKDSDSVDEEDLYQQVKRFVIDHQKASTSYLQRFFNIGYGRAARMLDNLEAEGIVGPQIGTKPRDVLVRKESNE